MRLHLANTDWARRTQTGVRQSAAARGLAMFSVSSKAPMSPADFHVSATRHPLMTQTGSRWRLITEFDQPEIPDRKQTSWRFMARGCAST